MSLAIDSGVRAAAATAHIEAGAAKASRDADFTHVFTDGELNAKMAATVAQALEVFGKQQAGARRKELEESERKNIQVVTSAVQTARQELSRELSQQHAQAMDKAKGEWEKVRNELTGEYKAQISEEVGKREALERTVKSLEETCKQANALAQERFTEMERQAKVIEGLQKDLSLLNSTNARLQEERSAMTLQIASLMKTIAANSATERDLKARLSDVETKLQASREALEQGKLAKEQSENGLNGRIAELDAQLKTSQDVVRQREFESKQNQQALLDAQDAIRTLTGRITVLTGERDTAIGERDGLRRTLGIRTAERDNALTDLGVRTTERNTARANLVTRTTERDTAVNELATRTTERDNALADVVTRTTERNTAQADLAARTLERDQMVARLTTLFRQAGVVDSAWQFQNTAAGRADLLNRITAVDSKVWSKTQLTVLFGAGAVVGGVAGAVVGTGGAASIASWVADFVSSWF